MSYLIVFVIAFVSGYWWCSKVNNNENPIDCIKETAESAKNTVMGTKTED